MSLFLCKFDPLNIDFFIDEFVDKCNDFITLDGDQDEAGARWAVCGWIGASSRPRVNKVLAIILYYLVLVGVPTDQDVHIELPLHGSKSFKVAPRYNLVTMDQTDFEVSDLHHLGLWQLSHVNVEVTPDCMHLRLCRCEVLKPLKSLKPIELCFLPLSTRCFLATEHIEVC